MRNKKYYYNILEGQYSTEKSVKIADLTKGITFKVYSKANKYNIKTAVEKIFKVKVSRVRVLNVKGKVVKFKNKIGKKNNWKKAIVFLKKGYDINFAEME